MIAKTAMAVRRKSLAGLKIFSVTLDCPPAFTYTNTSQRRTLLFCLALCQRSTSSSAASVRPSVRPVFAISPRYLVRRSVGRSALPRRVVGRVSWMGWEGTKLAGGSAFVDDKEDELSRLITITHLIFVFQNDLCIVGICRTHANQLFRLATTH